MAYDEPWKLSEDGYLNVDIDSDSIIYHPNLNIILVSTKSSEVHVIDVNSGVILQTSSLSGNRKSSRFGLRGTYLVGHDKILYTDGRGIGVRRDYNGVLLLDTILQTPIHKPEEVVKLELLLSEAILLQQSLKCVDLPGVDHMVEVQQELAKRIKEGQEKPKTGTKAQKWNSVCLEIPHAALKLVCSGMVQELKRQNHHIPALSIASAINERLGCLLPSYGETVTPERCHMFSEAVRIDTFVKWPHMNYKWALPDHMAQAGFYHQPNSTGDDRAMCFTCNVCLVCWEPTDEPWSEHERHSPSCPFVKGEYTQNVPLSVTYATSPATPFGFQGEELSCVGTSSVADLVPTATRHGLVVIWNVARQLKKDVCFYVAPAEITKQTREVWPWKLSQVVPPTADIVEIPLPDNMDIEIPSEGCQILELTAVSVVGGPHHQHPPRQSGKRAGRPPGGGGGGGGGGGPCPPAARPCLVGGVSARVTCCANADRMELAWGGGGGRSDVTSSPMVRAMNDVNEASNRQSAALDIMKVSDERRLPDAKMSLYLVVYDFHYSAGDDGGDGGGGGGGGKSPQAGGGNPKKLISGTGTSASTSGSRQENNNMYQEIFLSKFLYDVPVIDDTDTDVVMSGTAHDAMGIIDFSSMPSSSSGGGGNGYPQAVISYPQSMAGYPQPLGVESSVSVSFATLNGNVNFPSTSDGSPPPLVFKVSRSNKKDGGAGGGGGGGHSNGVDGGSECRPAKRSDPSVVQCVPLPEQYRDRGDLSVLGIHPTRDGGHLLVLLGPPPPPHPPDCDRNKPNGVDATLEHSCAAPRTTYQFADDLEDAYRLSGGSSEPRSCSAVLLVYALDLSGAAVRLAEAPSSVRELSVGECPAEVVLLPLAEKEDEDGSVAAPLAPPDKGAPQGQAALVCRDGAVRVVDLHTLRTVAQAAPQEEGAKFVSAAYCNSLERLCACTDRGSLHFFMLRDGPTDGPLETADPEANGVAGNGAGCPPPATDPADMSPTSSASAAQSPTGSCSASDPSLLVNRPSLDLSDLRRLHDLTRHENLSPLFSATVPPCWTEMMQAQKQRRHPQHLQQGDETQHTRSWRLQNDATTWDEHVFELTLPRSCSVGHVDLKFSLHAPCHTPPNVQVTLLKQNANAIGRKELFASASSSSSSSDAVDQPVDFSLTNNYACHTPACASVNPVTTSEYLREHNTEILCGPVNLSSCLDLSEQGGSVTLTSPQLFAVRGRTLLLHMKAISDKDAAAVDRDAAKAEPGTSKSRGGGSSVDERGSASKKSRLDNLHSLSMMDRLTITAHLSKTMQCYLGCDWLHEVSVTVRRTKQTSLPHERVQRCVMLESAAFAEKLLRVCLEGHDRVAQGLALDILIWVASVRLGRHRSSRPEVRARQHEFSRTVERHLGALVQRCLLLAGRSLAHKLVKLIVICSEGMKNATDSVTVQFDACVLRALLEWLPAVLGARSAGSLRWYLLLLGRVMALDVSATAGQKCLALLQQVAQELGQRANPYHLLLRTRFGLYGTPFEPELFDLEPPVSAKSTSMPITYATVVSNSNETPAGAGGSVSLGAACPALDFNTDALDLRELLALPVGAGLVDMVKGIPSRLKGLSSNHYMKGLLEVEPLHFTCHAASDGTKMERLEPGAAATAGPLTVGGNFFDPNNFVTSSNTGTKVADSDFICFQDFKTLKDLVKGKKVKSKSSTVIIELDTFEKTKNSETSSSSSSQQSTVSGPAVFQSSSSAAQHDTAAMLKEAIVDMQQQQASRQADDKKEEATTLPWQQLLVPQPQYMLVIERMHSGARRFAVIDFGSPVLLTDLLIPSCSDLVSLSVDIWCQGEETDGQRLVVAADIGTKSLVMSDLQPPPICRYLKITTIGRYGMSTTRCRIPIGSFFGHLAVLPGEGGGDPSAEELSAGGVAAQLAVLASLLEDVHCRYSLACAKLRDQLEPLLAEETPNTVHMQQYLQRGKELQTDKLFPNPEAQRVLCAYQECTAFQHQLNVVRGAMHRLEGRNAACATRDVRNTGAMLRAACSDKLRVVGEGLLDILLYLAYEIGPVPRLPVSLYNTFDHATCSHLFERLCVGEDTRMQLATCTLLVRMCGLQPWWGDFLADTLTAFYTSQHTDIFPQDRVFLLLSYLGRKSLAGGAPRASVVDSSLATLARLLAPLANHETGFLRAEMDLSLIGWILLFLSICLDAGSSATASEETEKGKEQQVSTTRWDFIQGEVAMQKRLATTNRSNASKSYRRKLQKRLMHHKQQLEDLEAAKKAFHASTQALSALSSQAANLSSKLEAALKQHEQVFKKTLKQHSAKTRRSEVPPGVSSKPPPAPAGPGPRLAAREETLSEAVLCLQAEHCLPVARGLVTLILQMDFTCNIDMFLLACKVVARLVVSTRHAITLVELMSEEQLLRLVRLAVWNDQHKGSWGGPWASHAICCLLQDIIEGMRAYPAPNASGPPGSSPSTHTRPSPPPYDRADPAFLSEFPTLEELDAAASNPGPSTSQAPAAPTTPASNNTNNNNSNNNFQLPSLLESDDSELEDFLDDILERGRNLLKRGNSNRVVVSASSSISTALDARLEYGVEGGAETMLKRLTALGAYNLPLSVNAAIQAPPEQARQRHEDAWDSDLLGRRAVDRENAPCDSYQMLTNCFDKIFCELHTQNSWTNLELVLQMWITLNVEATAFDTYDQAICPIIFLSPHAASGLMAALAWHPGITLRTWSLAFQCLTVLSGTPYINAFNPEAAERWQPESEEEYMHSFSAMSQALVNDPQFVPMLLRFLSGSGLSALACSAKGCAGPSVCVSFHDFLTQLQMRCDVIRVTSQCGNLLKDLLLKLVYQLVQPSGALPNRQGPLDAQCKLVDTLLHLNFDNADVTTCMNIVDSVVMLVYTYILSLEKVKCRSVSDSGVSASSCFGGLFASVLGGEAKQSKPATWDALVCGLLKLVNKLVQIPLQGIEQEDGGACLADSVLLHHPTMLRLLSSLAGCSGSTLAMLLGSTSPPDQLSLNEFGEPLSVGDAVFQLLSVLARKATEPQLVLRPTFDFLSSASDMPAGSVGVMQLSEPLLWFILRVIDSEHALEEFAHMGGVTVVCENLVKSNVALINAHPSLVSIVMQHFSNAPGGPPTAKKPSSPVETYEGLLNFAPLGTIASSNPTAQPADILIQSAPPHRRARTPAWSYHFYPDETWVDLTLSLPCAVLLKEVQLQPHLTSLATCPSAVAVEVCRDAAMVPVPACPPLDTSGLTFIRLTLPQPEVVTSVLVRLYKPRDSSNIGLSQIRLLGSTTFGETAFRTVNTDVPDEELLTKSSLGWLRLLHHCLCLPADNKRLSALVLDHTSWVPRILEACCGLLLIPAPSPLLFTPSLERVLLKLGLHSREQGLKQINTLLRNGAAAFVQGSLQSGGQTAVVDSVVELVYQLCATQDEATGDRVGALLGWLHETATAARRSPAAAYVHSAAAILWAAHETGVTYDLVGMVTEELFAVLYDWTLALPAHSALKKAIDALLCAMCYVRPALFPALLRRMGVLLAPGAGQEVLVADFHVMELSECQLMTIGTACQSPPAVLQLLDSGLPTLLTFGIVEFCRRQQQGGDDTPENNHVPMLKVDAMAAVLDFLAEVCSEGRMRDWLGSDPGSYFWLPLLSLLCNKSSRSCEGGESYAALEAATIKFLSRCCCCHPANQQLLAGVLCEVIRQQRSVVHHVTYLHGISGFTRRLVLQLLLEDEKLDVFVGAAVPMSRTGPAPSGGCSRHPRYGVGHQRQLMRLSTQTQCGDILKHISISGNILPLISESKGDVFGDQGTKKDVWEIGLGLVEQISLSAGTTAKDKRAKDVKNAAAAGSRTTPYAKRSRANSLLESTSSTSTVMSGLALPQPILLHEACGEVALPATLTLSQLLHYVRGYRDEEVPASSASAPSATTSSTPAPSAPAPSAPAPSAPASSASTASAPGCLALTLTQQAKTGAGKDDMATTCSQANKLLSTPSLPTPLQVFSQAGGLALLAQHLPLVHPETLRYASAEKANAMLTAEQAMEAEWIKVEASDDIYEDLEDPLQAGSSSPGGRGGGPSLLPPPSVPPHSLAAFGLFLRLPGYADVLLRDRKKAQCLLRLVLGVTDDGEGGDIFSLPVAMSLHTLPFQVLRQLFDSMPLSTVEGALLRRTTVDIGAIHLLLGCLSVFTHQQQDIALPTVQHDVVIAATKATVPERSKSDDKSHLYWAKGTGFGTGSTAQSWNVEQALMRQRSEEEHVTVLLQVISCFINPGSCPPPSFYSDADDTSSASSCSEMDSSSSPARPPPLPPSFHDLIEQSCLLPAVSSYLRNDSVLDMARHIPLYRAVLQLLRAMAYDEQLAALLLPPDAAATARRRSRADELSVVCLLTKMKGCVDTYASRLRLNRNKGFGKARQPRDRIHEEMESDEGLALFIFDIQETANLVQIATDRLVLEDDPDGDSGAAPPEYPLGRSLEERYLEVMKRLQFDSFEMIAECATEGGGYQFVVSYHFESSMRAAGDRCHPSRVKRLAQETVTLSTSLPLSYSSSVFVRCDTDRLDIMKVLITGPAETPYANGCFEFDVYFPPEYPNAPMMINLETTGHHTIRFNPNLYNDGKVCLSVLNTWHGRPEEKWNAQTSSFLQVLVSIQSLILVPEPYFNEPGYERSRGTPAGNQSSREYNSNICQATVKWAMLEQVKNPCPCFKEMIHTHFWMKRKEIVTQVEGWIADMESQCGDRRTGRAISLNAMALKRHFRQLREELAKLQTPEGLSDLADSSVFDLSPAVSPDSKDVSPTAAGTPGSPPMDATTPNLNDNAPEQNINSTETPEASAQINATPASQGLPASTTNQDVLDHDTDIDMEMEKMVSKVCE